MARDVEFNYTASDKTGEAAASAQRRMKQTADAGKKQQKEVENSFAKGVVAIANSISPKLGQALTRGFESAAEAAPQLLVGAVAAAAPLAGSLISAGIIGGIGLGGIVGGVAIASKDPRVQASFAAMKADIGDELKDAAKPFVQTSIDGIDEIGAAVKSIDFDDIFAQSAKNARPVIAGISSAVRELGGAVEVVIDKSGPVLDQIGASIADLGQHTGDFLETVAGGSEGAAAGLKDATSALDEMLDVAGPVLRVLTEIYGFLSKFGIVHQLLVGLLGPVGQLIDLIEQTSKASGSLTLVKKGIGDTGAAAAAAADPLATFTQRVDDLAQSGRSLFDSSTQVGAAIDNVTAAAKKNGKTLDENTSKGRANRDALSSLAGALVSNYDAYVKVNGEGAKSNGIAAQNREQFVRLAQQFGKSKTQAEALATSMGLIPAKKATTFTANTHDAAGRIEALKEQAASIKNRTVTISVVTSGVNAAVSRINSALGKFGNLFDASNSFAFAAPGAGSNEPARSVQVHSDVHSSLYLDGSLVYSNTAMQVRAGNKRAAWRQKVGRR